MNIHQNTPKRFYSLDVLRGIGAFSVVLWHWQHFFSGTLDLNMFPFSDILFIFYTKGFLAVDMFFAISGFVFFWLYSKPVSSGEISFGTFTLLRISRLYPLYFTTLIIVAFGQFCLIKTNGNYFYYQTNDIPHFFLNLLLASSWGFESDFSFNGPSWSVSVEMFLYACFFAYSRRFSIRWRPLFFISILGFLVIQRYYNPFGRGIGSFFLGGCLFVLYQSIISSRYASVVTQLAKYLLICIWVITILAFTLPTVDMIPININSIQAPILKWIIEKIFYYWPTLVLFPITILSLVLIETKRGVLGRRISFIGDISFSSYMLHFPLQMLFYVIVTKVVINDSLFSSPFFMLFFFAVLIFVSFGSYYFFEVPAQKFFRRRKYALKKKSIVNT